MDPTLPTKWPGTFRGVSQAPHAQVGGHPQYFTHRITNGISEGINNVIKVIKRRSYGFPDFHNFFLKILDATGASTSLNRNNPQ